MVSNNWPSKYGTSINCWWIPQYVGPFEQNKNIHYLDISISSQKDTGSLETKSPMNGLLLTATKFLSKVSGIHDYIGNPEVLHKKRRLNNHKRENKQISKDSFSENFFQVVDTGNTVSFDVKSDLQEHKTNKRWLLFASCCRDVANFLLSSTHFSIELCENQKQGTKFSGDLENPSDGINERYDLGALTETMNYDTSARNNTSETWGKYSYADVSVESKEMRNSEESADFTNDTISNLTKFHTDSCCASCSPNPVNITNGTVSVLRDFGPDLHVCSHTESLYSSGITFGQQRQATDSCFLVAQTSAELSNMKSTKFQWADKDYRNELIHDRLIDKWFVLRYKLQDIFSKNRHVVAGALAGTLVSLCLHPVDTVKTIIQAEHTGNSSYQVIRRIISEKGLFGLYRGITSNIATSAPTSSIYTLTYESVKGALLPMMPKEYHSFAHCFAGGCASIATSVIFTPSEHIKQQMQVSLQYDNCWNVLIGCIKKGGFLTLYAGWGAVLCRNIPHSIIKFYTYESLKQLCSKMSKHDGDIGTLETLVCGGLAGSTAALFTTPFDVVKTRLQTQIPGTLAKYDGVFHALKEISNQEGLHGLYRGLAPRLAMYVSQGAIFFASYEFLKAILASEVRRETNKKLKNKPFP